MTPEQLRSLAARTMAEAAQLHTDAARLRSHAGVLGGLLDPFVSMSQNVWSGPAANDFENQTRAHAERVNEQASVLDRVAADLDRMGAQKEQHVVELRTQAAAIEAAVASSGVM